MGQAMAAEAETSGSLGSAAAKLDAVENVDIDGVGSTFKYVLIQVSLHRGSRRSIASPRAIASVQGTAPSLRGSGALTAP